MARILISALSLFFTLGSAATAAADVAPSPHKPTPTSFSKADIDTTVRPGDDFFAYANGRWLATTAIPDDRSSWGVGPELGLAAKAHVRDIVASAATHREGQSPDLNKVGDMYAAFMDEGTIERLGTGPAKQSLQAVDHITTVGDLASSFAALYRDGVEVPFHVYVHRDMKDASRFSAYVGQGGLGLPGPSFYTDVTEHGRKIREKYLHYIATLLNLAGYDATTERAESVLAVETHLASTHWSDVQNRNAEAHYNPMSPTALDLFAPGVHWESYLSAAGVKDTNVVVVAQPSAVKAAAILLTELPLASWRDYLAFHILDSTAFVLPKAFDEANFEFEKQTLHGTATELDRASRGIDMVNETLADAVGKAYVAAYFPPEARRRAELMVSRLVRATGAVIRSAEWMSAPTKAQALAKLGKVTIKVGYPDKWTDYAALSVDGHDAFGNHIRAQRFAYDQEMGQLHGPEAGSGWWIPPQSANAYANPFANEIVFPAAILQPPLFVPGADDATNFGAIGAIIGHEISHLFDDQGRKFDGEGKLADWWTAEDAARYGERTSRLVRQYAAYEPIPGAHLDGELTLSENIADLAGLEIAYGAYHLAGHNDQLFFLTYAQAWRGKVRPEALRSQLTTEGHSPVRFRAMTVRNLDAWYAAFRISSGDKMYLAPKERIRMW